MVNLGGEYWKHGAYKAPWQQSLISQGSKASSAKKSLSCLIPSGDSANEDAILSWTSIQDHQNNRKHSLNLFTHVDSFNPHSNSDREGLERDFTNKETEAMRGYFPNVTQPVICKNHNLSPTLLVSKILSALSLISLAAWSMTRKFIQASLWPFSHRLKLSPLWSCLAGPTKNVTSNDPDMLCSLYDLDSKDENTCPCTPTGLCLCVLGRLVWNWVWDPQEGINLWQHLRPCPDSSHNVIVSTFFFFQTTRFLDVNNLWTD